MATVDSNGAVRDYQGNTWEWGLEFFSDADGVVPQDVSNWLFFFALKATAADPDEDALVLVSHQAGSSPLDSPVLGTVVLRVPSDLTKSIPVNTNGVPYIYTLKRVIPQDPNPPLVETLEVGQFYVDSQVLQRDTLLP